jgi:hypothetical protein
LPFIIAAPLSVRYPATAVVSRGVFPDDITLAHSKLNQSPTGSQLRAMTKMNGAVCTQKAKNMQENRLNSGHHATKT